ncbi:hypothetical protein J3455_11875 [Pseudoalteromonas sp. NFXS39]|uniref:hypothetical protein n=1 Tax=Pseudoalteromonas sp. NFXS39 TaxID=2818437 RepID=UPI0032DE866B
MSKKLPTGLQKLLDQHKQAWQPNQQELDKRQASAKILYEKRYPTIGDTENNCQIVVFKSTFYDFLQEIHQSKWNEYEIDLSRSSATNGFKVFFIKSPQHQKQDLERISNEVKSRYKQELEAVKNEYIQNLLNDYNEQQAEAKAAKEQEQQTKLREQLLSLID